MIIKESNYYIFSQSGRSALFIFTPILPEDSKTDAPDDKVG
jgi:hypothetical protein